MKGGLNRLVCVFDTLSNRSNIRTFKKKAVAEVVDVLQNFIPESGYEQFCQNKNEKEEYICRMFPD